MKYTQDQIELNGSYILTLNNYFLDSTNDKMIRHKHHKLEISYVKTGKGMYTVDNKTYCFSAGDIFIFSNIETHFISKIEPNEILTNMVIEFEPEFTAKILKRKVRIYEVPISFNPRDYSEGKKIKMKDAFIAMWTLFKYHLVVP
jgi:hypothetical protein